VSVDQYRWPRLSAVWLAAAAPAWAKAGVPPPPSLIYARKVAEALPEDPQVQQLIARLEKPGNR